MDASIWSLLQTILPAVIAVGSGYVGFRFALRQMKQEKHLEFRRQQLEEFYSPLVGMISLTSHKAQIRSLISSASEDAWKQLVKKYENVLSWDVNTSCEPFVAIIDYDNNQLIEEAIPLFHEMLELFKDKYHLMEEPTRQFFGPLCEYVEIWDRSLDKSIPHEVMKQLKHDGSVLTKINTDALSHIDSIRKELLHG